MIFIQRSAGRSYSIVQQTNNFNQRRKGNLGGQNCSNREHEYIHRPNVVKTCFTCRRYTVKSPYLSRLASSSSDSVLALGCGAVRSLFSFANSVGFCLAPLGPQLGNVEDTRRKRNPCMLLTNQHCLKGARGTPASLPRFSECPHSETLFPCFTGLLSKLLHCLNICSTQVLDKLAISHFASSNERMLAANCATQGCNKVARSGRKIEQNEVPKPGPQNRQFCGDAYPHSSKHAVDFPMRDKEHGAHGDYMKHIPIILLLLRPS